MAIKGLRDWNIIQFLGNRNYEEANRIGDDFLYDSQNSRFDAGVWRSRMGYTTFADELAGGTEDKGLFVYNYHDGTSLDKRLVRYYNSTFYHAVGSTWTSMTTAWTNDTRTRGLNFENLLYVWNPDDGLGKISDSTFSVVDSSKKATSGEIFEGRLFLLGNRAAPYTLIGSAPFWVDATNIEKFATVDGGLITKLAKGGPLQTLKSFNQQLFVFANNWIYVSSGTSTVGSSVVLAWDDYANDYGAIGPDAVAEVENDLWCLTESLEVRALGLRPDYANQIRTEDLTYIIRENINELDSDQTSASIFYDGTNVRITLKSRGSSDENVIIIYNWNSRTWSVDKAFSARQFVQRGQNIYFSRPSSGQIYQADSGWNDNTQSFVWKGRTSLQDNARPDIEKDIRYIYIRGAKTPSVEITVNLYRDNFQNSSSYTIASTSSASSGTSSPSTFGGSGAFGEKSFAGEPASGSTEFPQLTEFNEVISVRQKGRMFGVELQALLNDERVEIYQIVISYKPKPAKHTFK